MGLPGPDEPAMYAARVYPAEKWPSKTLCGPKLSR